MQPNPTPGPGPGPTIPAQTSTLSAPAEDTPPSQNANTTTEVTQASGAPSGSAGDKEGGGATTSVPAPEPIIEPAPEIGSDNESGWAAIAKSIRDIDEQKIKDYKEDIDSILTFAGLYSAVLSALLVESFQALQPDPSAIMIALLGQLVSQTHAYTISNGYLNSTIPALDVSAIPLGFTPSLTAKRVNVLWFASLTLSLISASFGILVKQWLREYLTSESVSPHAQLQIRHFRAPALDDWQVFTIAALLPLILQLALALFFVGLCFFTLDIHQSIGYTTIPLVAGWAFLFLAASFAPALSPRCPYKLPVLIPIMTLLRGRVFRIICWLKGVLPKQGRREGFSLSTWGWQSLGFDEKYARDENLPGDTTMLIELDKSQTDDQLVMQMCSALKEIHTDPAHVIDFVVNIIASRVSLGVEHCTSPLRILDLSGLSVQTCTILMNAVSDVLEWELRKFPASDAINWSGVPQDCLFLLISRLPCLLSDKTMKVVSLGFAGTSISRAKETLKLIFSNATKDPQSLKPEELYLHLLKRLRDVFMYLNAWQFHNTISFMAQTSCCTCSVGKCESLTKVLMNHKADMLKSELGQYMGNVVSGYMLRQVNDAVEWNEWHRELLFTLFGPWQVTTGGPWFGALQEVVRRMVAKPEYAPHVYRLLFHRIEYDHEKGKTLTDALIASHDLELALTNLHSAFSTYVDEMTKRPELLDIEYYRNLLRFVDGQMQLMTFVVDSQVVLRERSVVEQMYLPLWQKIWTTMHRAMCHLNSSALGLDGILGGRARACLAGIDKLDARWLPESEIHADPVKDFERWTTLFDPAMSFFDDDIIRDLVKFLKLPADSQSNRVRRVHKLKWLESRRELAEEQKRKIEEEKIQETAEEDDADNGNESGADDDNDDGADDDGADDDGADDDGTDAANATLVISHDSGDACLADDRLVMEMFSTLESMHTKPDATMDFVLKIIGFQLRAEFTRPLPPILDLRRLPHRVCTILVKTVTNILTCKMEGLSKSEPIEWAGLTGDCLSLLVARLPRPLPAKVMAAVLPGLLSSRSVEDTIKGLVTSAQHEESQSLCRHQQHLLRNAFPHLDAGMILEMVYNMTKICCTCNGCSHIGEILMQHSDTISPALMQHTCDIFVDYMLHHAQTGAESDYCHCKILSILISQWQAGAEDIPWHGALNELLPHLLTNPKLASQFHPLLFDRVDHTGSAAAIFLNTFISSQSKRQILVNMYNAFSAYLAHLFLDGESESSLLLFTNGQMATMMYVAKNEKRAVVEALYLPIWQLIWRTMHDTMSGFDPPTDRMAESTGRASMCLEKIDELDNLWLPTSETQADAKEDFDSWVTAFNPTKSFFDDDLIKDLMKFLPEGEFANYRRVRRIQSIPELRWVPDAQAQETAKDDDDPALSLLLNDNDDDNDNDDNDNGNDDNDNNNNDEESEGDGASDDCDSLNTRPLAANIAKPTGSSPDNRLTLSTTPPTVPGELHADVDTNNSPSDISPNPTSDAKPDTEQPIGITHAGQRADGAYVSQ